MRGQQRRRPESRRAREAQRQRQVKEKQGRGGVEEEIGQVVAEGPQAPDREIRHVADRLQRAVIVQALAERVALEGRAEVGGAERQARILLYHAVVVPHEAHPQRHPESQGGGQQQARRRQEFPEKRFGHRRIIAIAKR